MPDGLNLDGVKVNISADITQLQAAIKKVEQELNKVNRRRPRQPGGWVPGLVPAFRAARQAIMRTTAALDNFGRRARQTGFYMSALVTVPIVALGKAFIKLASNIQESENLFNVALGRMQTQARNFSNQFARSVRLNPFEIRKSLGYLFLMTSAMGLSERSAYALSESMTRLSFDMASLRNLEVSNVFLKLQSALSGEIEPLKRIGILVHENAVALHLQNKGFIAFGQQLTAQEKAVGRYITLLAATKADQGDLARTMHLTENLLRRLTANWTELQKELGDRLLPLYNELIKVGLRVVNTIKGLSEEHQTLLLKLAGVAAAVGPVLVALGLIAPLVTSIFTLMTSPVGLIGMTFGIIVAWDKLGPYFEALFKALWPRVEPHFKVLKKSLGDWWASIDWVDLLVKPIAKAFAKLPALAVDAAKEAITKNLTEWQDAFQDGNLKIMKQIARPQSQPIDLSPAKQPVAPFSSLAFPPVPPSASGPTAAPPVVPSPTSVSPTPVLRLPIPPQPSPVTSGPDITTRVISIAEDFYHKSSQMLGGYWDKLTDGARDFGTTIQNFGQLFGKVGGSGGRFTLPSFQLPSLQSDPSFGPTTGEGDYRRLIRMFDLISDNLQKGWELGSGSAAAHIPVTDSQSQVDRAIRTRVEEIASALKDPGRLGEAVDFLKQKYGLVITSHIRTPKRNLQVDGVSNSQHLYGMAYDLAWRKGEQPPNVTRQNVTAAFKQKGYESDLEILDEGDHFHVEVHKLAKDAVAQWTIDLQEMFEQVGMFYKDEVPAIVSKKLQDAHQDLNTYRKLLGQDAIPTGGFLPQQTSFAPPVHGRGGFISGNPADIILASYEPESHVPATLIPTAPRPTTSSASPIQYQQLAPDLSPNVLGIPPPERQLPLLSRPWNLPEGDNFAKQTFGILQDIQSNLPDKDPLGIGPMLTQALIFLEDMANSLSESDAPPRQLQAYFDSAEAYGRDRALQGPAFASAGIANIEKIGAIFTTAIQRNQLQAQNLGTNPRFGGINLAEENLKAVRSALVDLAAANVTTQSPVPEDLAELARTVGTLERIFSAQTGRLLTEEVLSAELPVLKQFLEDELRQGTLKNVDAEDLQQRRHEVDAKYFERLADVFRGRFDGKLELLQIDASQKLSAALQTATETLPPDLQKLADRLIDQQVAAEVALNDLRTEVIPSLQQIADAAQPSQAKEAASALLYEIGTRFNKPTLTQQYPQPTATAESITLGFQNLSRELTDAEKAIVKATEKTKDVIGAVAQAQIAPIAIVTTTEKLEEGGKVIENVKKTLEENLPQKALQEFFGTIGDSIRQTFNTSVDAVIRGTLTLGDAFKQLGRNMLLTFANRALDNAITSLFDHISQAASNAVGGSGFWNWVGSGLSSLFGFGGGGGGGIPGQQAGGPVEAGMLYRVNETRREYFRPSVGGSVVPLTPTMAAGGSGGGGVVVNVHNYGNSKVEAKQRKSGRLDEQQLDIMIGDAVARDIRRGGRTSQAMGNSYGLTRRGGSR